MTPDPLIKQIGVFHNMGQEATKSTATLVRTSEAARLLGVSHNTVVKWADSGVLPCIRHHNKHRRFDVRDIEAYLAQGRQ